MTNLTELATEALDVEGVEAYFGTQYVDTETAVAELANWLDTNRDSWVDNDGYWIYNGPAVIVLEN